MAQKVHVTLVDDINGEIASETINFGLDGINFEMDVTEENAEAIREALAPYVKHARRVSGRKLAGTPTTASVSTSANKERLQSIRNWAKSQNLEVSERGRIKQDLMDAYDKANG